MKKALVIGSDGNIGAPLVKERLGLLERTAAG